MLQILLLIIASKGDIFMLRLLKLGVAMGSLFIVSVAVGKTSDEIDVYIAKTTSSEIMTSDVVVRSTPLTVEPERCVHLDNLHISDQPIVRNVDSNDFAIDSQKDDQSFFSYQRAAIFVLLGFVVVGVLMLLVSKKRQRTFDRKQEEETL